MAEQKQPSMDYVCIFQYLRICNIFVVFWMEITLNLLLIYVLVWMCIQRIKCIQNFNHSFSWNRVLFSVQVKLYVFRWTWYLTIIWARKFKSDCLVLPYRQYSSNSLIKIGGLTTCILKIRNSANIWDLKNLHIYFVITCITNPSLTECESE